MSWFSLIRAEKTVLDSQEYCKSALTGEFIGQYVVDGIFKKNQTYLRTREVVSSFFSDKLSYPLESFSAIASEKLLGRIVLGKDLPQLFPELFSQFHEIGHQISLEKKTDPSLSGMHQLIHHLFDKFIFEEKNLLNSWRDALEKGEEDLEIFVKKNLAACLMPVCKKALKAAFHTMVKVSIENFFDSLWKTGISIASAAIIYRIAFGFFGFSKEICKDVFFQRTFTWIKNYLPSPMTALWILTAFHAGEMINIFWKVEHLTITNTDLNKKQVKILAIQLTKDPIQYVLQNTEIYKILHLTFKQQKIDDFIILLINETVDHYWEDLHKIHFLNLPLVT